jgi:hypothetical protein
VTCSLLPSLLNVYRLIAIMLGRFEMDVDECISAYNKLMESVFGEKSSWLPMGWTGRTKAQFDSARLTALQTLEVDAVVRALSFSVDESCLETDRGLLDVTTPLLSFSAVLSRPALPRGILVKGQWVVRGKENLLWLPSDYRPTSVAGGSVVVLGHASGRISCLEFALS